MRILTDLHCHSIASDHAYSTIIENVAEAKKKGLEAIAVTEHTGILPDAPHPWFFANIKVVPEYIDGVRVFKGAEVNIINENGEIDMMDEELAKLDIVIASIHEPCYSYDGDVPDVTGTYLKVLENPYVDILGHTGSPKYTYDIDTVVKRAGELNKMLEINASSFKWRKSNIKNCTKIAEMCKKYHTRISVNSDSHICFTIGEYEEPIKMLKEIDFPEELIANRTLASIKEFLNIRKNIK